MSRSHRMIKAAKWHRNQDERLGGNQRINQRNLN